MKREARNAKIKELKTNGYVVVRDYPLLYINESGQVYNLNKQAFEKMIWRKSIKPGNKCLSVPKLILQAFANQPFRELQHIVFLDGNPDNIHVSNIKYKRLFEANRKDVLNEADLLTAIRCYFEVKKRFTVKDRFTTNIYLKAILRKRDFFIIESNRKYIAVYKSYIENNSIAETANQFNITIKDCTCIVHEFTNILTGQIIEQYKAGTLCLQPFHSHRSKKNETDKQRANNYLTRLSEYEKK